MKITTSIRLLQGGAMLVAALAAAPVLAAPTVASGNTTQCPGMGEHFARMQKFHQERLNHLHDALQLTAAQQSAWQHYAKAELAMFPPMTPPPADANPAAMAQFRADRATEMAQHLTAVSKATAELWQTLTTSQRAIFSELSPHRGPGMMRGEDRPPMPGQPPMPAPDGQ